MFIRKVTKDKQLYHSEGQKCGNTLQLNPALVGATSTAPRTWINFNKKTNTDSRETINSAFSEVYSISCVCVSLCLMVKMKENLRFTSY